MARGRGFQCKLQALFLEWVGPYDDEKLGFHKVAKYMHVPGVLELEANTDLYINKAKWAELPMAYQTMLRAACAYALMEMLAGYDARNPQGAHSPRCGRRTAGRAQPGHPEGAAHRARASSTRRPRKASSSSACSIVDIPRSAM